MAEINRNLWDRAANTWRRLVDTATIAWDTSTPGVASASVVAGSIGTTQLADGAVTNAKAADMAQATVKGRAAGAGTGDPQDLTAAQVAAIIIATVAGSVRFANGIQIASGTFTSTSAGAQAVTTFAQAFNAVPFVVATVDSNGFDAARMVTVRAIAASFEAQAWLDTGARSAVGGAYIAIGTWT